MSNGALRNHTDPLRGNPNTSFAAFVHAEHMLDRYGVAYVCRHPELLLGIVTQVDAGHEAYSSSWGYGPNVRDADIHELPLGRPDEAKGIHGRAIEAYWVLDDIFAPESLASGGRRAAIAHPYGHIPEGTDGKPTRYGRWYC